TGNMNVKFSSGTSSYTGSLNTTGYVSFAYETISIPGSISANAVYVSGGAVTVAGPIVTGAMSVDNSILTGPSDWTISSTLDLSFGTLSGGGLTTLGSGSTMTVTGSDSHLSRTLVNNGAATWIGASNGGSILYMDGATFQNNGTFTANSPNGYFF